MEELNVKKVDEGRLIVTNADGIEFVVAVDDVTLGRLRRPAPSAAAARVSPREIQAHLRAGLSRDDVAALTGLTSDEVAKFEGPVIAELEYIISAALALTAPPVEGVHEEKSTTVGARVTMQIERLGGTTPRWTSWRNAEGDWNLKCSYEVMDRAFEARWQFDPKHHAITPLDDEAASLLAMEVYSSGVIPRLRAVNNGVKRSSSSEPRMTEPVAVTPDTAASGVPTFAETPDESSVVDAADLLVSAHEPVHEPAADVSGVSDHDVVADDAPSPTADLLAALRKRRSESTDAPAWLAEAASDASPATPSITDELNDLQDNPPAKPSRTGNSRRNRAAMPTWDEIVFGTKVEDDLI